MLLRKVIICIITLLTVAGGAWASGEWYWTISSNSSTGKPCFTGMAGSASPIILHGTVVNNDPQNRLLFNGITLKMDDFATSDLNLYKKLWHTDPSLDYPECLSVTSGGRQDMTLGRFDLSSAAVGTYRFRLIGAAGYDSVAPSPDQMNSEFVTIEVLPVPEPGSLSCLGFALSMLALGRRRKSQR